jgi:glycosyltransferase involved in cell wall biosynthesis
MKLVIENSVTVITPTIGKHTLGQAIQSVQDQTYKNINHLIVIDGPGYENEAKKYIPSNRNITVTTTPFNTGGGGFYGHRIYAAYPHLLSTDYILFLDEDNWWDKNHVKSLIDMIEDKNLDWAYSLRKVYSNNNYLDDDCCESIGKYPIWFTWPDKLQYLIDTSSYCFKREFITRVCHIWHWGWGGDRRFFMIIKDTPGMKYETTGLHTLNYNLPDMEKAYGGDMEFFKKGNEMIKNLHGGKYPWLQ